MCVQESGGIDSAAHLPHGDPSPSTSSLIPVPDSHCHPTDTPTHLPSIPTMRASHLTAMSTNLHDQPLVRSLAEEFPEKVIPGFGWHPWFCHLIWDDEDPELLALWENGGSEEKEWGRVFKERHFGKVLKGGGGGGREGGEGRLDRNFIDALDMPRALRREVLPSLRQDLLEFKNRGRGVVLGEVGLDRGFRLPWPRGYRPPTEDEPGEKEKEKDRALSPYKVSMNHQVLIFTLQLKIAGELGLPASIHGVQAHGTMFDLLRGLWRGWEVRVESKREKRERVVRGKKLGGKEREWVDRFLLEDGKGLEELDSEIEESEDEYTVNNGDSSSTPYKPATHKLNHTPTHPPGPPPFPPRICLHSFSAPAQTLSQYLTNPSPTNAYPSEVYFGFSTTINSRNRSRLEEVLRMIPRDKVLAESDLHKAGEEMDQVLEGAVEMVTRVKGWTGEECRRAVGENWGRWVYGGDEWERRRGGRVGNGDE